MVLRIRRSPEDNNGDDNQIKRKKEDKKRIQNVNHVIIENKGLTVQLEK